MNEKPFVFERAALAAIGALCCLPTTFALAQQTDSPQTPANSAPAASSSTPSSAGGAGSTLGTDGQQNPQTSAAQDAEAPPKTSLSAGLDVYSGVSNFEGQKRFSDGFWAAGAGLAYPSVAYLRLQEKNGGAAKFSLGTGDLYRGRSSIVKQPVEAWYQKPVGKGSVTIGKYYVPFALQEWQYETKYGVQLQRAVGASDFTASLNYDRTSRRPNLYFHAGRNFSETANAGISLGAGEGLSYGSNHNKAVALDASVGFKDFKLFSEALLLQRRSSDRFTFFYSKLVYDKYSRLKPFVAYFKWNDKGEAFGHFRSIAYGATYELRPDLLLEGGGANTADKNIFWIQLHLLLERQLFESKSPTISALPGMPAGMPGSRFPGS